VSARVKCENGTFGHMLRGPSAASMFPYLDISEFASFGTNSNSQSVSNSLSFLPSVTGVKNKHTFHADLDARFIRLPRTHQFDANLLKTFSIRERLRLQVSLDGFNVLNHPLWSESPDGGINDSTFDEIERGPGAKQSAAPDAVVCQDSLVTRSKPGCRPAAQYSQTQKRDIPVALVINPSRFP
jgi:hypothetical protein